MEKTMVVKPYDFDVMDELEEVLLWKDMEDRGDGLMDIPAATVQLGIDILEACKWYVKDITDDPYMSESLRSKILESVSVMTHLRFKLQIKERKRRENK